MTEMEQEVLEQELRESMDKLELEKSMKGTSCGL